MKMFMIVYAEAADESVTAAFKKAGIRGYTKMKQAEGEGSETEPRLGTHYWPGRNNILLIAAEDREITGIDEVIKNLKATNPRAGVRGFVLPMEESF